MKTIGLIGGMSWESTLEYYRLVNQGVKDALGGLHSAKVALYSVDFDEVNTSMQAGNWAGAAEIVANAAKSVAAGGADFFLICTNTLHKVAKTVEQAAGIPLLHIGDATGRAVTHAGIKTVGLLGTKFTMEDDFLRERLTQSFGLEVLIPGEADRETVHRVIFEELVLGKIEESSKKEYLRIISELAGRGAGGVILGCTEIALLVKPDDTPVELFDTTAIHARAAVDLAISK